MIIGIFLQWYQENEFSADAYSVKTAKLPDSLISGLKKLSKENLQFNSTLAKCVPKLHASSCIR